MFLKFGILLYFPNLHVLFGHFALLTWQPWQESINRGEGDCRQISPLRLIIITDCCCVLSSFFANLPCLFQWASTLQLRDLKKLPFLRCNKINIFATLDITLFQITSTGGPRYSRFWLFTEDKTANNEGKLLILA